MQIAQCFLVSSFLAAALRTSEARLDDAREEPRARVFNTLPGLPGGLGDRDRCALETAGVNVST